MKKSGISTAIIFAMVAGYFFTSCQRREESSNAKDVALSDSVTLAGFKEAYLYGYPLVVMHTSMRVMTNVERPVSGARLLAPINQVTNASTFPDDKFRDVVRANCDTYYTMGWLNLKDNPMLLKLPDTKGRYALFPILDAWTNVFTSPGKRTTGTGPQQYVLAASGWSGDVPDGAQLVHAPTDLVWLIGRVQVNSALDGRTAVKAIQNGITLTPLVGSGSPAKPVDPSIPGKAPNDIVTDMPAADYFSLLAQLMVANPPSAADSGIVRRMEKLGIIAGSPFDESKLTTAVSDSLKTIQQWAKRTMMRSGLAKASKINGWGINRGLGSYGTDYTFRAGVAYGGLGANLDQDAVYPSAATDADGDPFDGSKHNYVLHFEANNIPPAKAFWSLTMYDNDGFMCANSINRFAIGDRDKLVKNKDGSLDILIQHDKPASTSNWLPAPNAPFNLLLRIYWPDETVTAGQWKPDGVKKAAK